MSVKLNHCHEQTLYFLYLSIFQFLKYGFQKNALTFSIIFSEQWKSPKISVLGLLRRSLDFSFGSWKMTCISVLTALGTQINGFPIDWMMSLNLFLGMIQVWTCFLFVNFHKQQEIGFKIRENLLFPNLLFSILCNSRGVACIIMCCWGFFLRLSNILFCTKKINCSLYFDMLYYQNILSPTLLIVMLHNHGDGWHVKPLPNWSMKWASPSTSFPCIWDLYGKNLVIHQQKTQRLRIYLSIWYA